VVVLFCAARALAECAAAATIDRRRHWLAAGAGAAGRGTRASAAAALTCNFTSVLPPLLPLCLGEYQTACREMTHRHWRSSWPAAHTTFAPFLSLPTHFPLSFRAGITDFHTDFKDLFWILILFKIYHVFGAVWKFWNYTKGLPYFGTTLFDEGFLPVFTIFVSILIVALHFYNFPATLTPFLVWCPWKSAFPVHFCDCHQN